MSEGKTLTPTDQVREENSDYTLQEELDHVGAINQVFAEFELAYHNQFNKAYGEPESLIIAKKYWLSNLENYSPEQIVHAAKRVISTQDFLPSISVFIRTCEEGLDLFGLPNTRQAYLEACGASSPKINYAWSHSAVYLAGKAAGWFLLANEPESSALPLFRYHYELLCQRVLRGEKLEVDVPAAITEKTEQKLSSSEKKARLAKLKKELGL